ncbi:MAG: hypothetical protein ACREVG_04320 [Burkholderiales bacterium]
MTLTVRLDPGLQQQLESYCRRRRLTKSQVITRLLHEHFAGGAGGQRSPYELARKLGLVGAFASGDGDLAASRKQRLKAKLGAKHSR